MLTLFLLFALESVFIMQASAQQAVVQVVPASYTVPDLGATYNVNITIQDVENLYGYDLKLYYPNDILNGTSATQGPFLKTGGFNTFFTANFTDKYNATNGLLSVLCSRVGNVSGADGEGTLVIIMFKSKSNGGPETLHLADVALSDPNPAAINFTTSDGGVTVVPEFPTTLILPLLMISASAAIILRKRRGH